MSTDHMQALRKLLLRWSWHPLVCFEEEKPKFYHDVAITFLLIRSINSSSLCVPVGRQRPWPWAVCHEKPWCPPEEPDRLSQTSHRAGSAKQRPATAKTPTSPVSTAVRSYSSNEIYFLKQRLILKVSSIRVMSAFTRDINNSIISMVWLVRVQFCHYACVCRGRSFHSLLWYSHMEELPHPAILPLVLWPQVPFPV